MRKYDRSSLGSSTEVTYRSSSFSSIIMSFASFLAAAPTPAKKRSRQAETAPAQRDEENMVKLLAKVSSVVLNEQRNQASRIGHTLLLPAEHAVTIGLTEVKDRYAASQPAREEGKPGKKYG